MARPKLKKDTKFQPSGEVKRIIPLGADKYAYLMDSLGKTHHLARDSDKLAELCVEHDPAVNGKISRDLAELGWDDVLGRMDDIRKGQEVVEGE